MQKSAVGPLFRTAVLSKFFGGLNLNVFFLFFGVFAGYDLDCSYHMILNVFSVLSFSFNFVDGKDDDWSWFSNLRYAGPQGVQAMWLQLRLKPEFGPKGACLPASSLLYHTLPSSNTFASSNIILHLS